MNPLRRSVINYLSMRRNLGFKLHDAEIGLLDFVSFMERKHVGRITTRLALEWAQKPKTVLPAQWAKRLGFVRGFARYQSALIPGRRSLLAVSCRFVQSGYSHISIRIEKSNNCWQRL